MKGEREREGGRESGREGGRKEWRGREAGDRETDGRTDGGREGGWEGGRAPKLAIIVLKMLHETCFRMAEMEQTDAWKNQKPQRDG